ncbi:unnamed protein product [Blepharisma stoltei]|uniref:Uncharacterized protein n=1 Tax=Blepharisma stoltei TaxID=1481888 RepID=A0AAU9J8I5_9CILI|nr:unnamed protein product [Blepharisma stoltei]
MEALNEIEELVNLGVEDKYFTVILKKNCFTYRESKIILLQGRFMLKNFDQKRFKEFLCYLDMIENVTITGIPEKFKNLYIENWIREYLEILKKIIDNKSTGLSNLVAKAFEDIIERGLELFTKFLKNRGKFAENSTLVYLGILDLIPIESKDICDLFLECISYNYLMGKITGGEYESVHIIVYKILTAILKSNKETYSLRRAFITELFEFAIEISNDFLLKKIKSEGVFISVFKFALECVENDFLDHIRMLDDHKYVFKNIWGFVIYMYDEIYQKTRKFAISNEILEISKPKIINKLKENLSHLDDCLEMFTNFFHEVNEDHLSDKLSDILIDILKIGNQAEITIDLLDYFTKHLQMNLFSNKKYIKYLKKILILSSKPARSELFLQLKPELSPVKNFENMMTVYNLFDDIDEKHIKKIAVKLFKNYLIEQDTHSYRNLLAFCEKCPSLLLRMELEMLRKILVSDDNIMLKQKYFKIAYEKVLVVINPLYGLKFDENILLPIDRNKLNDLWIYLTFFEQAGKVFGINADFTHIFSILSKLSRDLIIENSINISKNSKILKSRLIFMILQEEIRELLKETYEAKKTCNNLSLVYCIAICHHLSNLYSSKYFLPLIFSYLSQESALKGDLKSIYTKILISIITESFHELMHTKITYELWSNKLIYDIYELMESSISHIKIVKETAQEMLCLYLSKFKGKSSMRLKSCYLFSFPWIFQYKEVINKALTIYYELNKKDKSQKDTEIDIIFFRKFIYEGLFKSFKNNKTAFSSAISAILYDMKNQSSSANEFKISTLNNIYWEFTAKKMNKTFSANMSSGKKINENQNKATDLIQDQDINSKLTLLVKNSRLTHKFSIKDNHLSTPIIFLTTQLILDNNIFNIQFYFNYLCKLSLIPEEMSDFIWCWKWIIYTKRFYIDNLFENLEKEWKNMLNHGGMVAPQCPYINSYKLKYESPLFVNTQSTYYNNRYKSWANSTNLEDFVLSQSRFLQFLTKECSHISIISEKALFSITMMINEFLSKSINPSILDSHNCLYEQISCLVFIIKQIHLIYKFRFLQGNFIDFTMSMFMFSSRWVMWNSGEKTEKFYKLILNLMEVLNK